MNDFLALGADMLNAHDLCVIDSVVREIEVRNIWKILLVRFDFRSGVIETCVERCFGFAGVLMMTFFTSEDINDPTAFTVDVTGYWE